MLGKQRPFPLLSCQQIWDGFQAREAVSQVGCDWMDCQTSLSPPLGMGHALSGESGLVPCPALLTAHLLGTSPTPSTFHLSCNLLERGHWLPVPPWINSILLSFTHFCINPAGWCFLCPLGVFLFLLSSQFCIPSTPSKGGGRCLCSPFHLHPSRAGDRYMGHWFYG